MLPELNPFIRYANILVVNDSHKTACIGLDCRIFYCLGGVAHIKIKDETVELSKGTINILFVALKRTKTYLLQF